MFCKKLPNGKYRYYEKYYSELEGKWKQVSVTLVSKSRQAQAQAKRLLSEKIELAENEKERQFENVTVSDLLKEWLVVRRSELKESSYRSQLSMVGLFEKDFGKMSVKNVTVAMLQKYLLSQSWSKGYLSLNKARLSIFFDYACQLGYIETNPVRSVVLPKARKTIDEIRRKSNKFLSREEMSFFLAYLKKNGSSPLLNILIEVLYLTGMRVGEILALRWEDVDLESRVIHINHTLNFRNNSKEYYLSSPKTVTSIRTISISSRVVELLGRIVRQDDPGFVFLTKDGLPYTLGKVNYYLRKHFFLSGIDKGDDFSMTTHVLRHSHISLLVEMNIPLRLIMERVGHADEKITLAVYTHVTKTMSEELVKRLEEIKL